MSSQNDLTNRLKNISAAVDAANDLSATQKDEFYKDLPRRIDTILGEDQHLHSLKQLADARTAWMKEFIDPAADFDLNTWSFANWLRDRWGVELIYDNETLGLSGYAVVDAQKHLLFTMVFP